MLKSANIVINSFENKQIASLTLYYVYRAKWAYIQKNKYRDVQNLKSYVPGFGTRNETKQQQQKKKKKKKT